MSKKTWIWAISIALFPPLLLIPITKYLLYFPIKHGVIGGSKVRFYLWGIYLTSLSVLAYLPMLTNKKLDLLKVYSYLNDPENSSAFIFISSFIELLIIFLIYSSTRNEPDQKQFLPIKNFRPDKLFFICLALAFAPYILYFSGITLTLDEIKHPSSYSIAVSFVSKNYVSIIFGILKISILTAILEESFFRGILLRDYFNLGKKGKYILLFIAALYFAYCHMPISFIFPFIFALLINRVRLNYDNLVPGMILHALWNANVTIVITFLLLNPYSSAPLQRTDAQELLAINQIWNQRDFELAKKLFPKYKTKEEFYAFEGLHSSFLIITDNSSKILFLKAEVEIESSEKIEQFFFADDWEHKKIKSINMRCSKKNDMCIEKIGNKNLLQFNYDHYSQDR